MSIIHAWASGAWASGREGRGLGPPNGPVSLSELVGAVAESYALVVHGSVDHSTIYTEPRCCMARWFAWRRQLVPCVRPSI